LTISRFLIDSFYDNDGHDHNHSNDQPRARDATRRTRGAEMGGTPRPLDKVEGGAKMIEKDVDNSPLID